VFIGGASQIFETPEFADVEKMRSLFRAFEDKYKLITLLDKTAAAEGIKVFIGSENPFFGMQGAVWSSAVTRRETCWDPGRHRPVRMQYKQVIQVVDYTSRLLSASLTSVCRGASSDDQKTQEQAAGYRT